MGGNMNMTVKTIAVKLPRVLFESTDCSLAEAGKPGLPDDCKLYCAEDDKLDLKEILGIVDQASRLGVEEIIITDENFSVHPWFFDILAHIRINGLRAGFCTFGMGITREVAQRLFTDGVNVILMHQDLFPKKTTGSGDNCFCVDKEILKDQDAYRENNTSSSGKPSGEPCSVVGKGFYNICDIVNIFMSAGYPDDNAKLFLESIISREHLTGIPGFWRWARDNKLVPLMTLPVPGLFVGADSDKKHCRLPEPDDVRALFEELSGIDAVKYKINWKPLPPIPGPEIPSYLRCCTVTDTGDIYPRKRLPISLGNIRQKPLGVILKESEVLMNLAGENGKIKIKGPCRRCDDADQCCGSRALAYALTGDYMGSDPFCWKNQDKIDQIVHLPASVDAFIPQKRPIQVITKLIAVKERYAEIESVIPHDTIFLKKDGTLEEVILFEMMAQAAAAMNGFEGFDTGESPHQGVLLGGKNIQILDKIYPEVPMTIQVTKKAKLGGFGVMHGIVLCGDRPVAEGNFKVFREDEIV
ncbi:hypothetical protein MTBBW1_80166 [Desulfamplus magnetovallimortis]|uniref:Uncharacterized protein n=1 Tax=Desulfamplus magnetovallimortis TaxID=1246637 RepID=L0R5H4_9BACT|nr:hypothetical protein [Desulfamplus magnetovallimortis]CCO06772.1 hypothetical protein DEMABW1_80166 [Desulfamplus magnetovallimortis BW-1]SLM32823.1 hypothetical protein MTBBW1_80166 [Desulfamplus magnetovallimortis]